MRLLLLALVLAASAGAQTRDADPSDYQQPQPAATPLTPTNRTADTGIGQVGQRQTREQAAPNVQPLARIDNRIENRVQSRIRNRIDRYYDPQANAASPFAVAGERARTAGRRSNR